MTDTTVTLTAAQTAALAAGGKLIVQGAAAGTAPPVSPPSGGTAPKLAVVIVQNGVKNPAWIEEYDFAATSKVSTPGNGNPNCIQVTTTSPWGGYQPSNDNGKTTDFSKCSRITIDVSANAGKSFQIAFLQGGDQAIPGQPVFRFTKTKAGYETFSCPRAQVMTGADGKDYSAVIYKGQCDSQQGTTGDVWDIDNFGGLT